MLIKNAKLINGDLLDILIEDSIIKTLGKNLEYKGNTIDLQGKYYVSPGWIDMHTHAFPKFPPYYAYPDDIGIKRGCTTVVDAGSSGANDIGEFYEYNKKCITDIFAFINISKVGLARLDELSDLSLIDKEAIINSYEKYKDFIVGLKARLSASIVGENNLIPLGIAKEVSKELALPVMIHIGSTPPEIGEILDMCHDKHIVTHALNGKSNNIFKDEITIEKLRRAKERGLLLDIGHGSASFSFEMGRKAKELGIEFDSISSDIYVVNMEKGPVYSLSSVMSKFLHLGYSLEEIIDKVTRVPAKILALNDRGVIEPGKKADLTIFHIKEGEFPLRDSSGNIEKANKLIEEVFVVKDGSLYNLEEING